jgi:glucan biosynthesis protein C
VSKKRRYDIDWIRVIVFDILIIYHVGMFFVDWGWHIKNNEIVDWIKIPMLFINQWRIPILFVVSGMGTRFALSYRSGPTYMRERFARLFIPLVFGILIIVPPQIYIERLTQGIPFASFLDFYPHYFEGIYPEGNFSWHHLWFLPYLLIMSLLATPIFLFLRREGNAFVKPIHQIITRSPLFLYLAVLPLALIEVFLHDHYPVTHALVGDWYALTFYFTLFVLGHILICCSSAFWNAVLKIRYWTMAIGISAYLIKNSLEMPPEIQDLIKVINMWSWILTIFGFSAKYLNQESSIIKYRNKAVYPFYILHQTITVICGYYLINAPMHYSWKMIIMIVVTFLGAWIIYEFIILRIPFLQPLFGVKRKK